MGISVILLGRGWLQVSFSFVLFPPHIKLVGIIDVVPNAVEASRNGSDGSQKRVSHPNCEHRVFLPQSLPCTDRVVIVLSYAFPSPELQRATNERHGSNTYLIRYGNRAVHNAFNRHTDGKGQRDCPQIERKVFAARDHTVEARKTIAHEHCQKKRAEEQGENIAQDEREVGSESEIVMRVNERHEYRDDQGDHEVDKDGVCRQACRAPSQFSGDYGRSRGRRAYHA